MTREERLDWLCRLGAFLVSVDIPIEWREKFTQALSDSITELSAEPCEVTMKDISDVLTVSFDRGGYQKGGKEEYFGGELYEGEFESR